VTNTLHDDDVNFLEGLDIHETRVNEQERLQIDIDVSVEE